MSLSVLFASHHMIGWGMYLWLWKCMQSYDKNVFPTLAYPLCLFVCSICDFLPFTMNINLLMWVYARTPRGYLGDGVSAA